MICPKCGEAETSWNKLHDIIVIDSEKYGNVYHDVYVEYCPECGYVGAIWVLR